MDSIIQHIKQEWQTMRGAPIAFLVLLVFGLVGGFAGGQHFMKQEVQNLESLIRLKDGELDEYRVKIDERFKKIEKQLTAEQVSSIEKALSVNPSTVEIENISQGEVGKQLIETWKRSGWQVHEIPSSGDFDESVVFKTLNAESAETMKKALSEAGIDYNYNTQANDFGFVIPEATVIQNLSD